MCRSHATYVIKGHVAFEGGNLSQQVSTLPSLVSMGLLQVEIKQIQFVTWPHKTTFLRDHANLHVGVPCGLFLDVSTCLKGYVTLWAEASHCKSPPCYVGGCWSCANGDVKYLICHVISHNHVIEAPCKFMSGNSSFYFATLPSQVVISIVIVEMFIVFRVIKQFHTIKGSYDYLDGNPSR